MSEQTQETTAAPSTIADLLADKIFIENVKSTIAELRKRRANRPEPKPGFRYKRDWHDQMADAGTLNTEYFLANIEKIWLRKSSMTSATRKAVEWVCGIALQKTQDYYAGEAQKPND